MTPTVGFRDFLAACDRARRIGLDYAAALRRHGQAGLAAASALVEGRDVQQAEEAASAAEARATDLERRFEAVLVELQTRARAVANAQLRRGRADTRPKMAAYLVREAQEGKRAWRDALRPAVELARGAGPGSALTALLPSKN
jgi:hypothetical protein